MYWFIVHLSYHVQIIPVDMHPSGLTSVLCRGDIMRGQITLLKILYERDEPIARGELAERLRGDIHENYEQSFTGVLGAFGKRINATEDIPGDPGTATFLKTERRDGEIYYQLRPEAREAIETFDEPWNELLEPDTRIEAEDLVPKSD